MTKIDIISGFLGAGKTTLIKKLLQEAFQGEQIVLIENEFGEIGIDGAFLKDAGIEIREMNSGCICCCLVGDFGASMKEVIEKYHPGRIVIEPSGVGKLSDVQGAVRNVSKSADVVLNSSTTMVDAGKCKSYLRNFGEFFENQVEYAQTVILSRTDVVKQEKIQEAVQLLAGKMKDGAVLVTTPIGQLGGKKILETMEQQALSLAEELLTEQEQEQVHCHEHGESSKPHRDHKPCQELGEGPGHHHEQEPHHHYHGQGHCHGCGCEGHDHAHGHQHHHADEVFASWGRETARTYEKEQLEHILDQLSREEDYGIVLRAKGMVPDSKGTWLYFDMVPDEVEIRTGEPEYTGRLCVIGSKLKNEKLEELFGTGKQ